METERPQVLQVTQACHRSLAQVDAMSTFVQLLPAIRAVVLRQWLY